MTDAFGATEVEEERSDPSEILLRYRYADSVGSACFDLESFVSENLLQLVLVFALEFDTVVGYGASNREPAFYRRGKVIEIDGCGVESLNDRHRLPVATAVKTDRDALFGPGKVFPDSEIVGKPRDVIKVVAHYICVLVLIIQKVSFGQNQYSSYKQCMFVRIELLFLISKSRLKPQ